MPLRQRHISDASKRAIDIARASGGPSTIGSGLKEITSGVAKIYQFPHKAKRLKLHVGPIHSPVAGRTDHLNIHVPSGSYVIPADIISGMGEGNTMAGFKVAKNIFSQPFYGSGSPYGSAGLPYHAGAAPYGRSGLPYVGKAAGGETNAVPIVAAGGEYVVAPRDVERMGHGSLDHGHRILDEFVKKYRAKLVKTLKNLPGPRSD